jgi:hypothetical protein
LGVEDGDVIGILQEFGGALIIQVHGISKIDVESLLWS